MYSARLSVVIGRIFQGRDLFVQESMVEFSVERFNAMIDIVRNERAELGGDLIQFERSDAPDNCDRE